MWVLQIFQIIWQNIFAVRLPIFGGVSFGGLLLIGFIGYAFAGYLNQFMHRGE